jgi:hypothetical protein
MAQAAAGAITDSLLTPHRAPADRGRMAVVCHCPNCLGEVIGRFQRICLVCGHEIPAELRMAGVPELEAHPFELRRASTLQQRVLVAAPAPRSDSLWPDPNPFEDGVATDDLEPEEPREMDWEDDEPAEPERRRRWFRR